MAVKNKNILVTGANGFVGKALLKALSTRTEFTVFGIDRSDGDISKMEFNFKNINHVIHLAARTYVPDSWQNPIPFYQTNVIGTLRVLEFCKRCGASATVLSSYVYGEPDYLPINEKHPRKSFNPYCHTKILMEDICDYYANTYQTRISILRPFNIYGPDQSEIFLIPTIIKQVLSPVYKEITVLDLKPKRDFVYIDDLIKAILLTIPSTCANVLNVGSGTSHSVFDIINIVMHISGIRKDVKLNSNERPNEVMDIVCDNSKIRETVGWSITTRFEEGISKCINFYLNKFNVGN
jgi:nucleoside-diphosphate-sugar epimerase